MEESGFQVSADAPRSYQGEVARFMVPFAESLVRSCVEPGHAVLDVACGTGFATRAASSVVGPSGRVIGCDINKAMLIVASEVTDETGDGITWDEASALDLPYEDGAFDRVISQQGIQFFPDTVAGLTEMTRVTSAGGVVAATVWSDLADTPYFAAMHQMLREFCGARPEDLEWSSEPGELGVWFAEAGLTDVSIERVEHVVTLPPIREYVPVHMVATPWASVFAALSAGETEAAIDFMAERMPEDLGGRGATTSFVSNLAIGLA